MKYQKNEILEVRIESINDLGYGIAKKDGAVFFIQNGVPGDTAQIRVIKAAKNYMVARIERLISPSPERTEPLCPYAKRCGGCQFWHLSYPAEKEWKQDFVQSAFRRAGLDAEVLPVLSNDKFTFYRNKVQFPFSESDGKIVCGFYSEKTHRVCPVEKCLIQDEDFSAIASFVCRYLEKHSISVYNEETGKGLVRHLYLRKGKKSREILFCLVMTSFHFPDPDKFLSELLWYFPNVVSVSFNLNPRKTNVILGERTVFLTDRESVSDMLCGKEFEISPLSFYQVNRDMAETLYQKAYEFAGLNENSILVDLYCGIGTISLSCPNKVKKIIGAEVIPQAVENARKNAAKNGVSNAEYFCGDAGTVFSRLSLDEIENTCVFVDPPRKGLSESLIRSLSEKKIPKIVYISCNPSTLARDLALFQEEGHSFSAIQPVDLFPRTGHVETVVRLSRSDMNS